MKIVSQLNQKAMIKFLMKLLEKPKTKNLKEVIEVNIEYQPVKVEFDNVGTYSTKTYGK